MNRCSRCPQVQRVAAAGVVDGPAPGRLRRQGNPGAAETSRSAAADQQKDGGRRSSNLLLVHRPQHGTGARRTCPHSAVLNLPSLVFPSVLIVIFTLARADC